MTQCSPLYVAVIRATDEAIYNSLFTGHPGLRPWQYSGSLPLDRTVEILRQAWSDDRRPLNLYHDNFTVV